MNYELVQIITGTVGAFAFGILFNLKGKRLAAAAAGGLLCCVGFIVLSQFIESEPINYFLVSMIVSVYAEAMARNIKTPATPLITTSLIPLIPGGSLYYTVASAFDTSFGIFSERAFYTLKLATALALGMILVLAATRLLTAHSTAKKQD